MGEITKKEKYVKLLKDGGDGMGVETNCLEYREFIEEFNLALSQLIESGKHKGDWLFQFGHWIPQAFEIANKLKGYKSEQVTEEKISRCGCCTWDRKDIEIDTANISIVPSFELSDGAPNHFIKEELQIEKDSL